MNEYDQQAETFIRTNKIKIEFNFMGELKTPWDKDHKHNTYSVIFSNEPGTPPRQMQITFYDSTYNTEKNLHGKPRSHYRPKPYDILACISNTYYNEDFNDFCSEYGYDNDSIKAFETWKAVNEEAEKMEQFFTEEELTELREIN